MSLTIDQIDSSHTKPPQFEHDGQPSSGPILPSTLTVSQRGQVTLLGLSRPDKRNALDLASIAGLEKFFSDPPKETRRCLVWRGKAFFRWRRSPFLRRYKRVGQSPDFRDLAPRFRPD